MEDALPNAGVVVSACGLAVWSFTKVLCILLNKSYLHKLLLPYQNDSFYYKAKLTTIRERDLASFLSLTVLKYASDPT